ncbi:proteasome subunit alpha [Candidatus Pacearchaeota archaeon]|nr:proteasome subunit alpha [Candidatus Pacearchaeota archaeon]
MPTEMQHQAMGYDRAATMFSPDGHLLQVEYAEKTVRLGSASIALACKDGVVIVADKRVRDSLIAPESAHKIFEIDEHIIMSAAGILSDARMLVDEGQMTAQQHRVTYDSPIEPLSIIKHIADKKQMFTQYGGARPFGVAVMIAGVSKGKGHVYTSDVTGNFFAYKANAIGEHDEKIKEELRKDFKEEMSMDEGASFALSIFKKVQEKNFEVDRFEIARVPLATGKLERVSDEDVKKLAK